MRFKVTADIPGEPKSRQLFAPDRRSAGDAATVMLKDTPVGTEVKVWECKEELVQVYVKKEERRKTEIDVRTEEQPI